ncbi:hypothetical protein H8356DRAFT_1331273 [Neocallimastix lanati (nom. inval.)]|nr:hypothetical protein H8356DRAFT_1331273 [Neocallimastix sp. JGI-2020a]
MIPINVHQPFTQVLEDKYKLNSSSDGLQEISNIKFIFKKNFSSSVTFCIHTSCPYNDEPSIYKLFINYIISINITSFWNQKSHPNNNSPVIPVKDFNMSFVKA